MKNNVGLHLILLDMPKTQPVTYYAKIYSQLKNAARALSLTFLAIIAFGGLSYAQSSAAKSNNSNHDISYKLRKEEKKESREEKRNIKEVESISPRTMELFKTDFPKAKNVSWSVPNDDFTEADFTRHNSQRMAFFDFNNQLIGTGKYINYNQLPAKGREQIAKEYKDYTPQKAMYYDDNETNDFNLDIYETPMDADAFFALMKDGNKEIVLKISDEGNVTFFSSLK